MFEILVQDSRYALRTLWREPAWTLAAVATLALAIGPTTAIFTFVNGILLQPLEYDRPDDLVAMQFLGPAGETGAEPSLSNHQRHHTTYPNFLRWREATAEVLGEVAAYDDNWSYLVGFGDSSERLSGALVSAALFDVLRVQPSLGRSFARQEDDPGGENVLLLSHALWQRRFGGRGDALGASLTVGGESFSVVGILPQGFAFPSSEIDLWMPMATASRGEGSWNYRVIGRLGEGVSLQRARTVLEGRGVQLLGRSNAQEVWTTTVTSLQDTLVGDLRRTLLIFLGAVAAVLLIACVNVINLTLTRAAGREQEHVLRAALGASRARLMRQLLTESTIVSVLGGVVGLGLAASVTDSLLRMSPTLVPRARLIEMDATVLLFAFGLTVLVGGVVGLFPALRAARTDLAAGLGGGARASSNRREGRVREVLVVVQTGLAVVLLVSAGLLLRSFLAMLAGESGFQARNVMTFEIALPGPGYATFEERRVFYEELLSRVEALPGARSAAVAVYLPAGDSFHWSGVQVDGYEAAPGEEPAAEVKEVSPGYFRTLDIGLIEGRLLDQRDDGNGPPVVVINETMARRYWPERSAIGEQLGLDEEPATVVGVVGDVRYRAGGRDHGEVEFHQVYLPYAASGRRGDMDLLVRTDVAPSAIAPAVRRLVAAMDPEAAVYGVMTLQQRLATRVAEPRFRTLLLGGFGLAALALAVVGVYGVMAYSVTQRTHEVGIRMALGAARTRILREVLGRGLRLVIVGLGLGLATSLATTRMLESYLYDLAVDDPVTLVLALAVLGSSALLACLLPALRAARVDPMGALRTR